MFMRLKLRHSAELQMVWADDRWTFGVLVAT